MDRLVSLTALFPDARQFWGPDKRAYIATLRQAKFQLPRQVVAAAAHVLRGHST